MPEHLADKTFWDWLYLVALTASLGLNVYYLLQLQRKWREKRKQRESDRRWYPMRDLP